MRIDRRALRWLMLAVTVCLAGCRTISAVSDSALFGDEMPSQTGNAVANLTQMSFASAYVQAGPRFDALVLLGTTGPGPIETWYGAKGMTVVVDDVRVLYTRGLPDMNIAESIDAGAVLDYQRLDCGRGRSYLAMPTLRYNRLEGADEYFAELTESQVCRVESLASPGYLGDALRVDEVVAFPPHRKRQLRTRWLHPGTGQLLRLQYEASPYYPELDILWLKVARRVH